MFSHLAGANQVAIAIPGPQQHLDSVQMRHRNPVSGEWLSWQRVDGLRKVEGVIRVAPTDLAEGTEYQICYRNRGPGGVVTPCSGGLASVIAVPEPGIAVSLVCGMITLGKLKKGEL